MKIGIIFFLTSLALSVEYYVSATGSSLNSGSISSPFSKVQQAADVMQAGDICYIREGVYHENIIIENHDGLSGSPIVFTAYNDERVIFDGTVLIDYHWIE